MAKATGDVATAGARFPEDLRLATDILRRDRKATADFVDRYADSVYGYLRARLAPHTAIADDLLQEVFLAALVGLGQFRGDSTLAAWLLGIARHKVQDYYRTCLRSPGSLADVAEDSSSLVLVPDFDERLHDEQLKEKTSRVLALLPETYRVVLLWCYWDRCPAADIAARLGKTEKAVERLLARAREQFRRRWNDG